MIGQTIGGRYKIIGKLGEGGIGNEHFHFSSGKRKG